MSNSIIQQEPAPVKPLTVADLTAMASQDLYRLGLTDAHIAALDAADALSRVPHAYGRLERQQFEGMAARATDRAAGVTLADVSAILGYMPAGSEG